MELLAPSHVRFALICVDLQIAFVSPDGAAKNSGMDQPIKVINELAAAFRQHGQPVIHSRYVFESDLSDVGLLGAIPLIYDGYVCDGHPQASIDPRVDALGGDLYDTHNRPSAFSNSSLTGLLAARKVDAVVLCGVSTNNAIAATAHDAFELDIPVVIAGDAVAVAPYEPPSSLYLEILDRWTAQVMTVSEICALVEQRAAVATTGS